MYTRTNIRARNEEIRQIWTYLRKTERRESDYVRELLQINYHISKYHIYRIIAEESDPEAITSPSFFYLSVMPKPDKP